MSLNVWRDTEINDAVLAAYFTALHQSGKSLTTIDQVVAAVKWPAKNVNRGDVVAALTLRTLQGIRPEGNDRGHGQVDELIWKDVEQVCSFVEASQTLAGLRNSAIINLMSDCLLRISEVVTVNVGDVKGNVLHVKANKIDQEEQ